LFMQKSSDPYQKDAKRAPQDKFQTNLPDRMHDRGTDAEIVSPQHNPRDWYGKRVEDQGKDIVQPHNSEKVDVSSPLA